MSTAGYGMKFSKGYLNGGSTSSPEKAMTGKKEDGGEHEGGDHHSDIKAHLEAMHDATGEAHSHVEHHSDGTHTSHHIHADGTQEGPHEHPDAESMAAKMQEMGGGEPEDQDEEGGF